MSDRYKGSSPDRIAIARGDAILRSATPQLVDADKHEDESDVRDSLRDLDRMIQEDGRLSARQKDTARTLPISTAGAPGHPLTQRNHPDSAAIREPLSHRQAKARSKAKNTALRNMPQSYKKSTTALTQDKAAWSSLNRRLSDNLGDTHSLDDEEINLARRVDRYIEKSERANTRGHRVYVPVNVDREKLALDRLDDQQVREKFQDYTHTSDQYMLASHQIHEALAPDEFRNHKVVYEITTRRGAYLGDSTGGDTSHLLPRDIQYEFVDSSWVDYRDPAGTVGRVRVIQLKEKERKP